MSCVFFLCVFVFVCARVRLMCVWLVCDLVCDVV